MARLTGIGILKWNAGNNEATSLGLATDLSNYGSFQRGAVKEMMMFVARTVAKRMQSGQRHSVQRKDFFCHAHNKDGLVGVVFADKDYPVRSAFCVINKVIDDFVAIHGRKWRAITADSTAAAALLEPALVEYQDPCQADKLESTLSDLDETKVVLHRDIESMLERGEKLDALAGQSEDLGAGAKMFYKPTRKNKSCCTLM